MEKLNKAKMIEIFESTNINFLIGSGLSFGAYDTLSMEHMEEQEEFIELYYKKNDLIGELTENEFLIKMKDAQFNYEAYIDLLIEAKREEELIKFKEKFIKESDGYGEVKKNYKSLFGAINNLIMQKDNKKLVNIFTSNYDMLINEALEENNLSFNDGFYRENRFELDTLDTVPMILDVNDEFIEVPHYNLIKFHGSLDWNSNADETIMKKQKPYDSSFVGIMPSHLKYNNLLFSYTYYDLINRMKEALSKSNSTLFILGFSLRDEHIKKIIETALKKNKTLLIIFVSYSGEVDEFIDEFNSDPKFIKLTPSEYSDVSMFDLATIIKLFKLELGSLDE